MQVTNAKKLDDSIPIGAAVIVTLSDLNIVKEEYRGRKIAGFWNGVHPNPNISDIVRSQWEGSHWHAHVIDPRSEQLHYDILLSVIDDISFTTKDIRDEVS